MTRIQWDLPSFNKNQIYNISTNKTKELNSYGFQYRFIWNLEFKMKKRTMINIEYIILFSFQERVRVSELWLAPYSDSETGFLLGWPAPARTFLVTFCTQAARNSWWRELQQALATQLRLEPPTTNIKVVYRDPLTGTECVSFLLKKIEFIKKKIYRICMKF